MKFSWISNFQINASMIIFLFSSTLQNSLRNISGSNDRKKYSQKLFRCTLVLKDFSINHLFEWLSNLKIVSLYGHRMGIKSTSSRNVLWLLSTQKDPTHEIFCELLSGVTQVVPNCGEKNFIVLRYSSIFKCFYWTVLGFRDFRYSPPRDFDKTFCVRGKLVIPLVEKR